MKKKIKIGLVCLLFVIILFGVLFIVFQGGEAGSECFTDSQCLAATGYNAVCKKGKCEWEGGGNFKIPHLKWCTVDAECQWKCGYGCVNKYAKFEKISKDIMYDCYPGMDENYSCACKDKQCETIKNK